MKRTNKYPDTYVFHYNNVNPKNRITGDCVFRAFTLAMEKPYNEVVMEMAEMMCKTGYALNDHKGEYKYLVSKGWYRLKQPRKADGTKYTGEEFCKILQRWLPEKRTHFQEWNDGIVIAPRIIANIGGHHVVAIIDGVINDIWDSSQGCIGNYWIYEED